MSEANPTPIETIATTSDTAIDAAVDTVEAVAKTAAPAAKTPAAATKIPAAKAATPAKKPAARTATKRSSVAAKSAAVKPVAKRKYVRKAVSATKAVAAPIARSTNSKPVSSKSLTQGIKIMDSTNNMFAAFTSVPGADKFQSLFAGAGEKSQDVVRKGQAFAETLTDTARANMEAVVESTRIAAAGARDLGHEVVASTKTGVEQATAAVKTLAEAKSPTEFFQLQSELVRASFDRFVSEGSKLTEQMVKLAGEASQPLSNRASVNAEKFNELTA